jgi:hypothetical protein
MWYFICVVSGLFVGLNVGYFIGAVRGAFKTDSFVKDLMDSLGAKPNMDWSNKRKRAFRIKTLARMGLSPEARAATKKVADSVAKGLSQYEA